MRTAVFLVILGISATYAYEEKITESGVSRKSRGISVGSHPVPHLHTHGYHIGVAAHSDIERLPILGVGPAVAHAVAPAVGTVLAPVLAADTLPAVAAAGVSLSGDTAFAGDGLIFGDSAGSFGASGAAVVGATHIDLGSVVQQHIHVINRIGVPIEQPYPVQVERRIPISVPHPVDVPVDRPYPVHVPVKYTIKIVKNIPVPVEKPVPVPVKVSVKVPVEVPFKVFHPHPVAVPVEQRIPIPVPDPVIVKRPIPVAIHAHLEPLHLHNTHHHH